MTIMSDDPNTDTDLDLDDDDADLSAADRGDNVEDDAKTDDKPADDKPADDKPADDADDADADADADAEEDDEDEDEDEDAGGDKNLALRLNKMRDQRDRERAEKAGLAARLAALEAGKAKPTEEEVDPVVAIEAELDALYEQAEEARADGDTKAAAALQRSIDAKNREIARLEAEYVSATTTTVARENASYDAMLDAFEIEIPAINPKHADFDPEAVRALEFYVAAHEKMGMKPTKALVAARNVVFGRAPAPTAKTEDPPAAKTAAKKPVNVAKVVETSRRQPPNVSDRGVHKDDVAIDPDALSDKEWDALPESKKAQLRGDML